MYIKRSIEERLRSLASYFPEVHYAPGLFRHVKVEIDRERHVMGRFILTGSRSFNLMKAVSDSLAGRCAILELENLSRAELTAAQLYPASGPAALELVARGQFPELWRETAISASCAFFSAWTDAASSARAF